MQPYNPDQSPYNPTPYNQAPPPAPKRERHGLLIVGIVGFAIFASLAFFAVAVSALSTGSTPVTEQQIARSTPHTATWGTLQSFSGNGSKKTVSFIVPRDWKMAWTCKPSSFSVNYDVVVFVYNADGSMADTGVSSRCSTHNTSGSTEVRTSGIVYLSIISEGDWKVTVQAPT